MWHQLDALKTITMVNRTTDQINNMAIRRQIQLEDMAHSSRCLGRVLMRLDRPLHQQIMDKIIIQIQTAVNICKTSLILRTEMKIGYGTML